MDLLIINTLSKNDEVEKIAIKKLTKTVTNYKVINTSQLHISHCLGCYTCMLETPGVCCLHDDYAEIFNTFFAFDTVIFISSTVLGFINHETINIIQRMLPLVTILSCLQEGRILHVPRYEKTFRLGLLYKGNANQELLETWFARTAQHFSSVSLGVFPLEQAEEVCACMSF